MSKKDIIIIMKYNKRLRKYVKKIYKVSDLVFGEIQFRGLDYLDIQILL